MRKINTESSFMKGRSKLITLFNKAEIKFTKEIFKENIELNDGTDYLAQEFRKVIKDETKKKRLVIKRSDLGFWYRAEDRTPSIREFLDFKSYKFRIRNTKYELIFPFEHTVINDLIPISTKIDIDTRPWELTEGMDDHFVGDLLKTLDDFFIDTCPEYLKKEKGKIYKLLFGYKDGPKFQTNDQKILSHGFDLKESFRNTKKC